MRELHQRLADLGFYSLVDPLATYASGTVAMVEAFQRSRGLPISGVVDETSWSRLVEAGWHLGQRLLYRSRVELRGDDVAELQVRLAQLGFNPGRIDGIFGAHTELAITDFQRNRGLTTDGTLTQTTFQELLRMTSKATARQLVTDARDRAGFDDALSGPLVLCGESPLALLVASAIGAAIEVLYLGEATCEDVAHFANEHSAAAVLSFQTIENLNGVHIHYWASYRSHSRRGEQLASALATSLSHADDLPRVEVTGMALPILRETKMTTLHIEHGPTSPDSRSELVNAVSQVVIKVFHREP